MLCKSLNVDVHAVVEIGNCHGVSVGSIDRLVVQMRRPMDVRPVGVWTGLSDSVTSVTCATDGQGDTLTSVDADYPTHFERIDATWTALTRSGFGDIEIRCEQSFRIDQCQALLCLTSQF